MIYLIQPLRENMVRVVFKRRGDLWSTCVRYVQKGERVVKETRFVGNTDYAISRSISDLDLLNHQVTYFGAKK